MFIKARRYWLNLGKHKWLDPLGYSNHLIDGLCVDHWLRGHQGIQKQMIWPNRSQKNNHTLLGGGYSSQSVEN